MSPSYFWPSVYQASLLKAAILPPEEAYLAFEAWRRDHVIEAIEPIDYHFMPLIYKQISSKPIAWQDREKLRGIYKHNWTHNQIRVQSILSLLSELPEYLRSKLLFMKGSAMILMGHYDIGSRVLGDIDLLTTKEYLFDFIEFFVRHGFQLTSKISPELIDKTHAVVLTKQQGSVLMHIDLHLSPLVQLSSTLFDASSWYNAACDIAYRSITVRCLNSADLLLQICVHGMKYAPVPLFRWIMDAAVLIRNQSDLDWERFLTQTLNYKLVLPVRYALVYLEKFSIIIPPPVKKSLCEMPVSIFDKIELHLLRRKKNYFFRSSLINVYARYRRSNISFIQCSYEYLGLENCWQLFAALFKRYTKG